MTHVTADRITAEPGQELARYPASIAAFQNVRPSVSNGMCGCWWSRLDGRARSRQCRGDGESLR